MLDRASHVHTYVVERACVKSTFIACLPLHKFSFNVKIFLTNFSIYGIWIYLPPPGYRCWDHCTPEKKNSFLGLIIAMGLKQLPATNDYWSKDPMLGCPELVDGWPIWKFWCMMYCLHLNDNSTVQTCGHPDHDKLHKIRPVLEAVCKNCLEKFHPSHFIQLMKQL